MHGPPVLADVVIGPHGLLTGWMFDIVARLAAHVPGRRIHRTDRFDNVDFLAEPRPICFTNYPSKSLIDAIDGGDVRVLVVIEDPIDVMLYLQRALGLPLMEAIRSQTASAVANLAIGRADHVRYLYRTSERTIGEIVADVTRHLHLTINEAGAAQVIDAASSGLGPEAKLEDVLAARGEYYSPPLRDTSGISLDPAMLAASEVVTPMLAMARSDTTRPIVWPTSVFKFSDQPDAPPPQTVEIAGPVRDLYYGPYLFLPPARYRVEAILAFSDEIKDVPFVLEVHGATWLAKTRINERRAGNYRGYFMLDHHDPTATVEIRLRNEQGVQKGRLSLIELLFFYIPQER